MIWMSHKHDMDESLRTTVSTMMIAVVLTFNHLTFMRQIWSCDRLDHATTKVE